MMTELVRSDFWLGLGDFLCMFLLIFFFLISSHLKYQKQCEILHLQSNSIIGQWKYQCENIIFNFTTIIGSMSEG